METDNEVAAIMRLSIQIHRWRRAFFLATAIATIQSAALLGLLAYVFKGGRP